MLDEKVKSLPTNRPRPLIFVAVTMLLAIPPVLAQTGAAFAEDQRFYVGIAVPVEQLNASFDKTVDNTAENTLVPEPRKGMVFQDEDSANTSAYGIGLLAGYRAPLAESSFYLSGEVDIALHGGAVEGQLAGIGESSERNQLGESWPDHWSFAKDRSYGFTLRLGGGFGVLRNLYALAGIRRVEAQFTTRYYGCLDVSPCSSAEDTPNFVSGTDSRDLDLQGWTVGLGLEKALGQQLALRAETRYTQYASEDWVTPFDDVAVTVPAVLEANEASLSLRLARYF